MQTEGFLQAQKALRSQLLDDRNTLPWQPVRDLAAHLLLYLDDPGQCWRLTVEWLRDLLDADRVDGGFALPTQAMYSPQAEATRPGRTVPSLVGEPMNVQDPSVAGVWAARGPVFFDDVAEQGRIGTQMRTQLLAIGTRSKLSVALWDAGRPIGLLCADWLELTQIRVDQRIEPLTLLTEIVLGPVFAAAQQMAAANVHAWEDAAEPRDTALAALTPAELRIAGMVAKGMTYKEIARELNRSFSTVDHQLRSVREKLGVSSTARLVRCLSEMMPVAPGTADRRLHAAA